VQRFANRVAVFIRGEESECDELRIVNAALAAGVQRIVYIAMLPELLVGANVDSQGVLQQQVRQRLRELPIRTVLCGNNYFQQSVKYFAYQLLFQNGIATPLAAEQLISFVNTGDIARFAVAAMVVPDDVFDQRHVVVESSDIAPPPPTALAHWDMHVCGPELLPVRTWVDALNKRAGFASLSYRQCTVSEFEQYLAQAMDAGFANNVANNHAYLAAHPEVASRTTDAVLFNLVPGVSPASSDDLMRFDTFVDVELVPFVNAVREQLATAKQKSS